MMSEGTRNIVEAMKAHGIRKVVVCLSGEPPPPPSPPRGPPGQILLVHLRPSVLAGARGEGSQKRQKL